MPSLAASVCVNHNYQTYRPASLPSPSSNTLHLHTNHLPSPHIRQRPPAQHPPFHPSIPISSPSSLRLKPSPSPHLASHHYPRQTHHLASHASIPRQYPPHQDKISPLSPSSTPLQSAHALPHHPLTSTTSTQSSPSQAAAIRSIMPHNPPATSPTDQAPQQAS